MDKELIADLYYVEEYARSARKALEYGRKPNTAILDRMRDLAEKVQRHFDPKLEEMGNVEARC
jgi:hypothetical protein